MSNVVNPCVAIVDLKSLIQETFGPLVNKSAQSNLGTVFLNSTHEIGVLSLFLSYFFYTIVYSLNLVDDLLVLLVLTF